MKITTYTLFIFMLWGSRVQGQSDGILLLDNIEKKIESATNQRDTAQLITNLMEAVVIFSDYGMEEKALDMFGKLTNIAEQHKQAQSRMSVAYASVARIYSHKKEFFIALSYTERALKLAEHGVDSIRIRQQLCDILLLEQGNTSKQKILENLSQIELLLPKDIDNVFWATHYRQKGAIALLNQQYTQAIFWLEKAASFFSKNKDAVARAECYRLLSEAFYENKEPIQSLYFLRQYNTEKDKIVTDKSNIKDVYENRKKDKILIISA